MMTRKLGQSDQAAIDMLLDRAIGAGNGNQAAKLMSISSAVTEERLSAVQSILHTVGQMPSVEPPPDLITRTLSRMARSADSAIAQPQQFTDPTQPSA